jgi:predicted transcriptional regulator
MAKLRRNKSQIILGILNTCQGGANKTKIVYGCNLNFKKAKEYLGLLAGRGLLEAEGIDPIIFKTTKKGEHALACLKDLGELIPELGCEN